MSIQSREEKRRAACLTQRVCPLNKESPCFIFWSREPVPNAILESVTILSVSNKHVDPFWHIAPMSKSLSLSYLKGHQFFITFVLKTSLMYCLWEIWFILARKTNLKPLPCITMPKPSSSLKALLCVLPFLLIFIHSPVCLEEISLLGRAHIFSSVQKEPTTLWVLPSQIVLYLDTRMDLFQILIQDRTLDRTVYNNINWDLHIVFKHHCFMKRS